MPVAERTQAAIQRNSLSESDAEQLQQYAEVLDSNPPLPATRQCKDPFFAVLFILTVTATMGAFGMFVGEIPKLYDRQATTWGAGRCGEVPFDWEVSPTLKTENGVDLRSSLAQRSPSARKVDMRRLDSVSEKLGQLGGSHIGLNAPEIALPGLTAFTRRLKALGLSASPATVVTEKGEDSQHPAQLASSQHSSQGDDCERACASFPECGGFKVWKEARTVKCRYFKTELGIASEAAEVGCWKKTNAVKLGSISSALLLNVVGSTFAGGVCSMLVAACFVKFASVSPGAATYCGIYFVPALWIFIAFLLFGVGASTTYSFALVVGIPFLLIGSCACFCTWCCWRDLIPLTIEVVAAVTSVVAKYASMLFIALCGSLASIVWTLLVLVSLIGYSAYVDGQAATIPRSDHVHQPTSKYLVYVQIFAVTLLYLWGGYVAFNTCHVAFAGVFCRWYFGKEEGNAVSASLRAACTTAFGSICLGSLVIAAVRAAEQVAKQLERDSQEEGNTVMCVIACILQCVLSCIGDILEWVSSYAYVQVAMRGLGFWDGCRATYALATLENLKYMVSAMLCDWVVTMASCLCALAGAVSAGLLGYLFAGGVEGAMLVYFATTCAFLGCFAGCISGGTAVGVIRSGTQTLLMAWAEHPDALQKAHPKLHAVFCQKTGEAEAATELENRS